MRELDERVDTLSLTSWRGSTQSSTCAEGGLLSIFEFVAGVVLDFSSVLVAQALAFEMEDVAFEQSRAM